MEAFIETFHIDWKIIIAQLINFIIVLFVLKVLALKPLKKLMSERNETITLGLSNAKKNKEILENTQKEYEETLARARLEAHALFQEGKKDAEQNKQEMIEQTHKEIENMLSNNKKILEAEKVKMMTEAKKEIVSLVIAATEKMLASQTDTNFDKKSLDQLKNM